MALGASIVDLCLEAAPDAEVRFLQVSKPSEDIRIQTRHGIRMVPVTTCRMSHRAALHDHLFWILIMAIIYRGVPSEKVRDVIRRSTPWIEVVAAADLVGDVRGGDSFSDIYGLKRFCLAFLPALSVILIKGSIVHFPQTYGPFRTRTARCLARLLLRCSSMVIARDRESQRIAQDMVGSHLEVRLSPDVAFSLHSELPAELWIEPPFMGTMSGRTVGLNVNGLMFNGGYNRDNMFGLNLDYRAFLPALISGLLTDPLVDLMLVPHTFAESGDPESDNEACQKVREMLPAELQSRVRVVVGDYDAHQLKGLIRQCDFFIGSRMHSCIAALAQGVPCVGVAYSMKFAGVFESVGMEDWVVDGRITDNDQAVSSILALYEMRNSVRSGLAERSRHARQRLSEVFNRIVQNPTKDVRDEVDQVADLSVQPR